MNIMSITKARHTLTKSIFPHYRIRSTRTLLLSTRIIWRYRRYARQRLKTQTKLRLLSRKRVLSSHVLMCPIEDNNLLNAITCHTILDLSAFEFILFNIWKHFCICQINKNRCFYNQADCQADCQTINNIRISFAIIFASIFAILSYSSNENFVIFPSYNSKISMMRMMLGRATVKNADQTNTVVAIVYKYSVAYTLYYKQKRPAQR